jgi:hypothetical protein
MPWLYFLAHWIGLLSLSLALKALGLGHCHCGTEQCLDPASANAWRGILHSVDITQSSSNPFPESSPSPECSCCMAHCKVERIMSMSTRHPEPIALYSWRTGSKRDNTFKLTVSISFVQVMWHSNIGLSQPHSIAPQVQLHAQKSSCIFMQNLLLYALAS